MQHPSKTPKLVLPCYENMLELVENLQGDLTKVNLGALLREEDLTLFNALKEWRTRPLPSGSPPFQPGRR